LSKLPSVASVHRKSELTPQTLVQTRTDKGYSRESRGTFQAVG
jgi:hypothetical protein